MSPDQSGVRTRHGPEQWPLDGPDIHQSSLKVDVPEFVPGQMYQQTGEGGGGGVVEGVARLGEGVGCRGGWWGDGAFWIIFFCFGSFRIVLYHFGSFGIISDHFWIILGSF